MRLKIRVIILILVFCSLMISLVACRVDKPNKNVQEMGLKVGLLVEGNIFDQSWDSLAYQTLRKIEREFHAEVNYYELNGEATDSHIEEQTIVMIDEGYHIIFGHGRVFQDVFNRLGAHYPDVYFIFFNGTAKGENVFAINFAAESIGFFAGLGAALMTTNNTVGVITALPNQQEYMGFQAGVRYINDKIHILTGTVGDWGDREKGKTLAYKMIDQGADVVIGFGDGFNIEVINAARERGVYAIGFLTDQSFIARDTVLYSLTQNVEGIYMDIVKEAMNNQLQHKSFPVLDFNNGGQHITPFSNSVPDAVQVKIMDALQRYIHGEFEELL